MPVQEVLALLGPPTSTQSGASIVGGYGKVLGNVAGLMGSDFWYYDRPGGDYGIVVSGGEVVGVHRFPHGSETLLGSKLSGLSSEADGSVLRSGGSTSATRVPERCEALVRELWDETPILVTESEADRIDEAIDELAQLGKTNKAVIPYLADALATRSPNVDLAGCPQEQHIMIALARTGDDRALPILEGQLMRPDDGTTRIWDIWKAAAFALGQTKNPRAVAILKNGIAAEHAASECQFSIEEIDPSAAPFEAASLPPTKATTAIQEFDRLANLTSSALAQTLAAMPIESKQKARKFLAIAVGPKVRTGDLDATLGALIDCMLTHRTPQGRIVIQVSKRSDGVAPCHNFSYTPKQWLQLLPEPDQWNHAIIRVGKDEYVIATH